MKCEPYGINIFRSSVSPTARVLAAALLFLAWTLEARATTQQVVFQITNQTIQNGATVSGSSQSLLPPAYAYSYSITGSCHATGDLALLIPGEVPIGTALDDLDPGASPPISSSLQGTVANPGGTLPFTVVSRTAAGSFAGGLGSGSITFYVAVDASGRSSFVVDNISFSVLGSPDSSTLVIDSATVTTTAVLSPVATTGSATNVTASSAVLTGTVNPNGDAATVTFDYGTSASYGQTTLPQVVPLSLTGTSVTASIGPLASGSTYHFRVNAVNTTGTTNGGDMTFVTLSGSTSASAPTVTTGSATNIGTATATVDGTINPNGAATTGTFEYGLTTSYGSTVVSSAAGSGTSPVLVTGSLQGLVSGTTYHFRLDGYNSEGSQQGSDATFVTLSGSTSASAPTVTTGTATNIGTTTATLDGTINPNGAATTGTFEYGLTTSYGSAVVSSAAGSGTSPVLVTGSLHGLVSGTTYHFRLDGHNSIGTQQGSDATFLTPLEPPPVVSTGAATNIGTTTATLHGSINPEGALTDIAFRYGLASGTSTTVTLPVDAGSGKSTENYSVQLTGLQPATTYQYDAEALGLNGFPDGTVKTFTTLFPYNVFAGNFATAIMGGTNATSGFVTVSVNHTGMYSASVKLSGSGFSFSGKLGPEGTVTATKSGLTLGLGLSGTVGSPLVTGTISGPATLPFTAEPLITGTMLPMNYTLMIPASSDASLPQGIGYASLTRSKTGGIKLTGKLNDGTALSLSGGLLADGTTWPFYIALYKSKGSLVGSLEFANGGTVVSGSAEWFKPVTTGTYTPGAFGTTVTIEGAKYLGIKNTPVLSTTSGDVDFTNGNLAASPLDIAVTLTSANKIVPVTASTDDGLSVSITLSTGIFTGSFKDPTSHVVRKFSGAMLQAPYEYGVGVFDGTTQAGAAGVFLPP